MKDFYCLKHGTIHVKNHEDQRVYCNQCLREEKLFQTMINKIKQYRNIHGLRYDYSELLKLGRIPADGKIPIVCKKHGVFYQRSYDHENGHGCPQCFLGRKVSIKQRCWLEIIERQLGEKLLKEYKIPETFYIVDGFHERTKTVYEFYGDAFHGNLNRYKENEKCHPFDKNINTIDLWNKTKEREEKLKALGYNIVIIWESDFDQLYNDEFIKFRAKMEE